MQLELSSSQLTTILIFSRFAKPGFRAGGPIQTISSIVDSLRDDFNFKIVTSDRDLGEDSPYANVPIGKWVNGYGAEVLYLPPHKQTISYFRSLLCSTQHDLLYLNSFFGAHFSIYPLIATKLVRLYSKPIILAPRGEFGESALKLKAWKKLLYLRLANRIGLYRNVIFQASSERDVPLFRRALNRPNAQFPVVPNMTRAELASDEDLASGVRKQAGKLLICYVGRISPIKNIHFAIESLKNVFGDVQFSIYGPKEDVAYLNRCQEAVSMLPENIKVSFEGPIEPSKVKEVLLRHHLFFSPSGGENFGHSIAEALSYGIPVLISDRTPWSDLASAGAGWDLSLESIDQFTRAIKQCVDLDQMSFERLRYSAITYARTRLNKGSARDAQTKVFIDAVSGAK